jgi:hypothetical protein
VGPDYWNVNLAVSKLINVTGTQRLEVRIETFQSLQSFQLGKSGDEL